MLSRDSRNEKKLKAVLRAQKRLEQRLEYIDWEEDFLTPQVNEFKSAAVLPELPETVIEGIQVEFSEGQGRKDPS